MKNLFSFSISVGLALCLLLSACSAPEAADSSQTADSVADVTSRQESQETVESEETEETMKMQMKIGDTVVAVAWEENESVEALKALCTNAPLEVRMSMYGGFEQVGSNGQSLPRNDSQTTTQVGDIVLYSGDQIVVFYGSNAWSYTRLGHISDKSAEEMAELLGNGDVTITIELE